MNLLTGIFIVKGANFKNWLHEEVPKLLAAYTLTGILIEPAPVHTTTTTHTLEEGKEIDEKKALKSSQKNYVPYGILLTGIKWQ